MQIKRKKGRIAGFAKPPAPIDVLWCGTNRPRKRFGRRANGWSFPPAVRELLLQECEGKTVLHLFGGLADFGTRLDMDPSTNPDVLGDAWICFKYFKKNSFDVVILDPPYFSMNQQEKVALLTNATHVARDLVIWFHTTWIDTDKSLKLQRGKLVRVGTQCAVRCIQIFRVNHKYKRPPVKFFERGPGMTYNRWFLDDKGQSRQQSLFQEAIDANDLSPAPDTNHIANSPGIKSRARRSSNPVGRSKCTTANKSTKHSAGRRGGQTSAGNALAGVSRDRDSTPLRPAECLNGKEPAQGAGTESREGSAEREARS